MYSRRQDVKIGIIIVMVVLILLGVFVIPRYIEMQQAEKELYEDATKKEETLRLLEAEKYKVERELSALNDESIRINMNLSSTMLLVTEPDERVMEGVYPTLNEKEYVAVLCLSKDKFPGKEGMMSLDDAQNLVEKGWEIAISVDKDTDIDEIYSDIKKAGLGKAEALYVPEGNVTKSMRNKATDLSIPMIIQHLSDDSKGDKDHTYVGSIGASDSNNKATYEEAVLYSEPIAISLGYTESYELFSDKKLKNILTSVDIAVEDGSTKVLGVKGTMERIKERDEKIASSGVIDMDRKTELENKLKEIEAKIEALK